MRSELPAGLFRLIAGTASDGIVAVDEAGGILFANAAASALFGYTEGELSGKPLATLMPEWLRPAFGEALESYLHTGSPTMPWRGFELFGLHRAGTVVPLQVTLVEAQDGEQRVFAAIMRDVSDRDWSKARLAVQYAVAEVLSNADDQYRAINDILRVVGEHLRLSACIVYLIESGCLRWYTGWHAPNSNADPFMRASHDLTFAKGSGLPGRVWATGAPETIEVLTDEIGFPQVAAAAANIHSALALPLICRDEVVGVIEYYSAQVRPFDNTLVETLTAISLQVRQFLERKRAEDALQESELRHRMIFENANDAFGISVDEHFVYVNQAFATMFGYSNPKELIGVSIYDTLPPAQHAVVKHHRERRLAGLSEPMRYQSRGLRRNGSEFLSEVRATDYWIDGRMYTLAILRDVTIERHAQDVLTQSNAALVRANTDLEQFAYAASHDLQEPLRMIMLYAQLLERRHDGVLNDDARQLLGTVTKGAQRINDLVKDLLSYTRAAKIDAAPSSIGDPNEVMQEVCATFQDCIMKTNATVTSAPLPILSVDRTHLVQLFQNLLSNALKYHRQGVAPVIHFSGERHDGRIELLVSDNGIGIPAEYQERIFGVFKRLHSQRVPGTGIGLAICKRIVEHYGGEIWVTSTPEVGSTFHLTLPVSSQEPGSLAVSSHDSSE